jgi:hypothetical protein
MKNEGVNRKSGFNSGNTQIKKGANPGAFGIHRLDSIKLNSQNLSDFRNRI